MLKYVSIIVPVYNAERYLRNCVDSILSQTYINFELLLINDGSMDSSAAICDEYALKDSRVRVFHNENEGASSARNHGIENSRGDYICFIDADDRVDKNYIINLLPNTSDEFLISTITYEDSKKWVLPLKEAEYTKENIRSILGYLVGHMAFCSPCCKMMRRDIIVKNNIRFDKRVSAGEDMLFMYDYLVCIANATIKTKNYAGYHYNINNLSLSHRIIPFNTTVYVMCCLHRRLKKIGDVYNWDYSYAYKGMLCTQFFNLLSYAKSLNNFRKIEALYKILKNEHVKYLLYDREYILNRRNFGLLKGTCISILLLLYRIFF